MGPFSRAVFSSKNLVDPSDMDKFDNLGDTERLQLVYSRVAENMNVILDEFFNSEIEDNAADNTDYDYTDVKVI